MMDGIYQQDTVAIQPGLFLKAVDGARPVVTQADNTPPTVDIGAGARVEGVWFGGTKDTSPQTTIYAKNDAQIVGNTFFGYFGGVSEGTHYNNLYQSNRFVNGGGGGYYHDIYISAEHSNAKIYDNLFVGGEGYKMHLWHYATGVDMRRNFLAEYYYGTVLQHVSDSAVDNVFWNHKPTPGAGQLLTVNIGAGTFVHNLFGNRTNGTGKWDQDLNNGILTADRLGLIGDRHTDTTTWPGETVAVGPYNGDGHVLPAPGTNYTHYAVTDLPALLGYSEAQIDAACAALIAAFGQTIQQIHDDATIEGQFAILRAVVDAWKAVQ
jgi:hypothetical protein